MNMNYLASLALLGLPPARVSQFQVWPNPLRPALGEAQMNFLAPALARLRIYALSGELVRETAAAEDGTAAWNGCDFSGEPVASGVYFIHVENLGEEKTFTVAVER